MSTANEEVYLGALERVIADGVDGEDRTGVGTRSTFGVNMRFDLRESFPAVTTKRLAFKTMITELMWFISGGANVRILQKHGCHIWDEWANEHGALGPVYGAQWRAWENLEHEEYGQFLDYPIDQLADLVKNLKRNPHSRRHILSAWNVAKLQEMALPPCHAFAQFYVRNGELSCMLHQRSGDMFLGVPFNIASYAALTHVLAHLTGNTVGELVHNIGDAHVYHNHFSQVSTQLARSPLHGPQLKLGPAALAAQNIDDFALKPDTVASDFFALDGYQHLGPIKAPVAV